MKLFFVRICLGWMVITFIPTTSFAADWPELTPDAVCSYLDWPDARKIIMVSAGKNVSDVNEASEALKKSLQSCTNVSSIMVAEEFGDVFDLRDAEIVSKAAEYPIDLVLVIRVYPGLEGQTSLFASFFNTKGEKVVSLSADNRITQKTEKQIEKKTTWFETGTRQNSSTINQNLTPAFVNRTGEHTHDGFFLRLNMVGLGFANASTKVGSDKVSISGLAGIGEFSIGGCVTENLALHFSVNGPLMVEPEISLNGNSATAENTNVSIIGIGVGSTYYFMPHNIYLTTIFGIASMEIEHRDEQVETENGFSFQISIGREWWVSQNWGLGIAGAFILQRMQDKGSDAPMWTNVSGGIMFSATYN